MRPRERLRTIVVENDSGEVREIRSGLGRRIRHLSERPILLTAIIWFSLLVHVVVLTAKGQPMSSDWRSRIPADHFLLKPFDPRALLEHVREQFARDEEPALVG